MPIALAVTVGLLYAAGVYLVLRRSVVKLVLGLAVLGTAANLLLFAAGRLVRGRPPIVPEGAAAPAVPYADPVPQALILTAIVIGFAAVAFTVVLVKRAWRSFDLDDLDQLEEE